MPAQSSRTALPRSSRRHFLYETDMKQSSYSQYDECSESQAAFKRNQKAANMKVFFAELLILALGPENKRCMQTAVSVCQQDLKKIPQTVTISH